MSKLVFWISEIAIHKYVIMCLFMVLLRVSVAKIATKNLIESL